MSRLAGHELLAEGAAFFKQGRHILRAYTNRTGGVGFARCSCGALSEVLDSGAKRKAWHRGHKDELRNDGKP